MLYRLRLSDLEVASSVMARAMLEYPVFTHVILGNSAANTDLGYGSSSERNRVARLQHVMRFLLGIAASQGEIVAPSPKLEAIAVWVRSENMRISTAEVLRSGFAKLPFMIGLGATRRLLDVGTNKHAERAKIMSGRYYLFDMLGVAPEHQGTGYGRLLIETKLEHIDREHERCYLETSDERNIGYYRRFGFEVIHEYRLTSAPVFCLLRSPR